MDLNTIASKIYEVRGQKVMLDADLAELYGIATYVLHQADRRNKDKFPEDFMFNLEERDFQGIRSQFVTASRAKRNISTLPLALTGIAPDGLLFYSDPKQNDFEKVINLSINHSGDTDSTGAITGNILGFMLGEKAIPQRWIDNLSNYDVIKQIGIDLHTEVKGDAYNYDEEWGIKYPPY